MVIRDMVFEKIADSVKPDAKKRVVLQHVHIEEGVTYHIYRNALGQIVLDPQVTIPASELWVFDDKEVLSVIDQGMSESANGQLIERSSFSKYMRNAT